MSDHLKPALTELAGTFILVFIGAGAGALGDKAGGIVGVVGGMCQLSEEFLQTNVPVRRRQYAVRWNRNVS